MATSGVDLSLSGLASGLDWKTLVQQLANAERSGETPLQNKQSTLNQQNSLYSIVKNQLTLLQTQVDSLKDPTLYDSRVASVADATAGSATVVNGAAAGTYTFNVSQLATTAQLTGTPDIANKLSPDGNLANVTLGTAGFPVAVTAGTFTVDGHQVTVATTDSLQQVFDKIATATNNGVTASYDSTADKITLTSSDSSPIILGSATDSSDFLSAARLYNNTDGGPITSTKGLGSIVLTAALTDSKTATPITDGGSGAGAFTINGVTINFNASTDSINNVIARINGSTAGVIVSYDAQNDRFTMANKNAGDIGIAVSDAAGSNFLAAIGLAGASLTRGTNCEYSVNGGDTQISTSNVISSDSSGVTGLSVTALKENSPITVTVSQDTSKVASSIQSFVSAYNSVESYIKTQSASSTDAAGKVTAGVLASDRTASDLASGLRTLSFSALSGLSGTITELADLGIQTNGYDNTLAVKDSAALSNALANNLNDVKSFFSDATNGLATKVDAFLTNTIGDNGSLTTHQANLTKQSTDIDAQIAVMEKNITADSNRWTNEFVSMEQTQNTINQQLNYLTQQINKGTL